jgi:hypothetical protein
LTTPPAAYTDAECCRAPSLPLLTRDVVESGLICHHCSATLVPFDDLPAPLQDVARKWASDYATVHAVAHWDDARRKSCSNYDHEFEEAAKDAERLLVRLGTEIAPEFLNDYPAVIWEDQDECLEVRPEDLLL